MKNEKKIVVYTDHGDFTFGYDGESDTLTPDQCRNYLEDRNVELPHGILDNGKAITLVAIDEVDVKSAEPLA